MEKKGYPKELLDEPFDTLADFWLVKNTDEYGKVGIRVSSLGN